MATVRSFFEALRLLGPLRVISQCGPSTFESICAVRSFSLADGWFNAIDPAFHWHLKLDGFGHLRSRDETHARSGRRVLFFELRTDAAAEPFLTIYLYRRPGQDFGPEQEHLFAELHAELASGVTLAEGP